MSWRPLLAVAQRRAWIVVLCTVLAAGSAVAVSASQEKRYSASASLLFRDPGFDQKLFGSTFVEPSADADREAATNVRLVSLRAIAIRTAEAYGRGISPSTISANVDVRAEGQSNLITVEMTDTDPGRAAELANEFALQYKAFRTESDRRTIEQARELIEGQLEGLPPGGADAVSLRTRANQLKVLAALQTGNAELVEQAIVPGSPSSPHVARNGVLGGLLGLLLGIAVALLIERSDRRLRHIADIARTFERPILGVVPQSSTFSRGGAAPPPEVPMPEAEAFRMIRANLRYFNVERKVRSVLVTSSALGEGKSTISWNLAAAAAGAGERVLLIEADLRRPTLKFGERDRRKPGLGRLLAGDATLDEALHTVEIHPDLAGGRSESVMDVIAAGPSPPNPVDLIESARMRALLEEAEQRYDFIVIDTPPAPVVSDAIPLIQQVSGVIVVSRLGTSTRDSMRRLRDQLGHLNAYTFGIVVNGVPADASQYGYDAGGYGLEATTQHRLDAGDSTGINGRPGARRTVKP